MTRIDEDHRQIPFAVRFDWGLTGAEAIASGSDVAVVVDVLSFTTTLSVAMDAGTTVVPWAVGDHTASAYARDNDAVLAVRRSEANPGDVSLSPSTLRTAHPPARLVLPSPNGSTIAAHLATETAICLGASLRNAPAVAAWIAGRTPTGVVSVVAAGERWPNGELRPSIEDLWGAGYVISELYRHDSSLVLSPEAAMASHAWTAAAGQLPGALEESASGMELIAKGYRIDVDIAAEVNTSTAVPVLRSGVFVDAGAEFPV